jgi:hypothetical protein
VLSSPPHDGQQQQQQRQQKPSAEQQQQQQQQPGLMLLPVPAQQQQKQKQRQHHRQHRQTPKHQPTAVCPPEAQQHSCKLNFSTLAGRHCCQTGRLPLARTHLGTPPHKRGMLLVHQL